MGLSTRTKITLWGRAGSKCSFSECRRDLIIDSSDTDDPSLVGEAAHISAEKPRGPRGVSSLSSTQRGKYANLILLCNVHHQQIDDQEAYFTVEKLKQIKSAHETWVRSCLEFDDSKQADSETCAGYIDEWAKKSKLDTWSDHTSFLLAPEPRVQEAFLKGLKSVGLWLFSRIWPSRYPSIRCASESFIQVVNDLVAVFEKHSERCAYETEFLNTKLFYKTTYHEHEIYEALVDEFNFHVDLIHDLTFEMTRSANYMCDQVRQQLDPSFRTEEGALLVQRMYGFRFYFHRPEYREEERTHHPYPGLREF